MGHKWFKLDLLVYKWKLGILELLDNFKKLISCFNLHEWINRYFLRSEYRKYFFNFIFFFQCKILHVFYEPCLAVVSIEKAKLWNIWTTLSNYNVINLRLRELLFAILKRNKRSFCLNEVANILNIPYKLNHWKH